LKRDANATKRIPREKMRVLYCYISLKIVKKNETTTSCLFFFVFLSETGHNLNIKFTGK